METPWNGDAQKRTTRLRVWIVNHTEIIIMYQLCLEKYTVEYLGGTSRFGCYAKPNKAINKPLVTT